jgi:hypothetical protein
MGRECRMNKMKRNTCRILVGKPEEDEMDGVCRTKGEKMNTYRSLMGKAEGRTPLGRPKGGWYNIKMDLGEIKWEMD